MIEINSDMTISLVRSPYKLTDKALSPCNLCVCSIMNGCSKISNGIGDCPLYRLPVTGYTLKEVNQILAKHLKVRIPHEQTKD